MSIKRNIHRSFLPYNGSRSEKCIQRNLRFIPEEFNIPYSEPFSGALQMYVNVKCNAGVLLNDCNKRSINCFQWAKENPEELLKEIKKILVKRNFTEENYYPIRARFNQTGQIGLQNAARYIYLLYACYNHEDRTNNDGMFNKSYAKKRHNPEFREDEFWYLSEKLNRENAQLFTLDFSVFMPRIPSNSFSYVDPPFLFLEGENALGWAIKFKNQGNHPILVQHIETLKNRDVVVIVSNFDNSLVRIIYKVGTVGKKLMIFTVPSSSYLGEKREILISYQS